MKRIILLYIMLVLLSTLGTALFMCYHHDIYGTFAAADCWQTLLHSLPQHLTVAGYVMALPLIIELSRTLWSVISTTWQGRHGMAGYMAAMSVPLLTGWVVNLVLYGYWGIVLDGTALFYLIDNPADALAESPIWAILTLIALTTLGAWGVYHGVRKMYARPTSPSRLPWRAKLVFLLLLCGLDFLSIRGGWTTSTMNPGRAYFSDKMPLNHAAVDPIFNFLYSLSKNQRFDQQYRFMSDEEVNAALEELMASTTATTQLATFADDVSATDSEFKSLSILTTDRPDILLILLESFSGTACQYLTPEADSNWMPTVNQAMSEGVAFTRFYANSFRTDRGVAATLAAYPGQPTNSVMKDQSKCNNLQHLSKRLCEAGYDLQFIHGGDVNFTNMQGFLRAGGISDIVGDTNFPVSQRLDKWGVRDDVMFGYVADLIKEDIHLATTPDDNYQETEVYKGHKPFCKIFLSLSSHEPFEVPFLHYEDPYLNSVAYTDSCLGAMIQTLKEDPEVWNDLLIIGLPDHCFAKFPADIQQHDPRRYHIPMFWTGGAVRSHCEVHALGQQTDLAATLLGQLGIDHSDFVFSKDMLNPTAPHYAFYAFSDGFGLITDSCQYIQDNNCDGIGLQPGTHDPDHKAERWGKAYLQHLYDDLQQR